MNDDINMVAALSLILRRSSTKDTSVVFVILRGVSHVTSLTRRLVCCGDSSFENEEAVPLPY